MNTANSQTPNLAWLYAWIHQAAEELRAKRKAANNGESLDPHPLSAANPSSAHQHYKPNLRKTKRSIKAIG